MIKSKDKVGSSAGLRGWSALAGAVALAVGLTACGGGGGGSTSPSPAPATPSGSTGSTTVATGGATVTTPVVTTVPSSSNITLSLVVKDSTGVVVTTGATVVVTTSSSTSKTFTASSGTYSASLTPADLATTSTAVVTVSLSGHKTATVNFTPAGGTWVAGTSFSAEITLAKLDSLAISDTPAMNPSSVYIGDGSIPTDKKDFNKFVTAAPIGLKHTVELGTIPTGAEGYPNLIVSVGIRGLDAYSCPGDKLTVFQSTSKDGARLNTQSVRLGEGLSDAKTAESVTYDVKVPGAGFKKADGKLFAEFAVDGSKCTGDLEYDDLEFAAVSGAFAK